MGPSKLSSWGFSIINYQLLCKLGGVLGHLSAIFEYLNIYHDFGHGGHGTNHMLGWFLANYSAITQSNP